MLINICSKELQWMYFLIYFFAKVRFISFLPTLMLSIYNQVFDFVYQITNQRCLSYLRKAIPLRHFR